MIELAREGPERLPAAALDAWGRLAELRGNPFLTPEWYRACRQADTGA